MKRKFALLLCLFMLLSVACSDAKGDAQTSDIAVTEDSHVGQDYSVQLEESYTPEEMEQMPVYLEAYVGSIDRAFAPTLENFLSASDVVVVGEILKVDYFMYAQKRPWTKVDLRVVIALKGPYRPGDVISFFSSGGIVPLWEVVKAGQLYERDPSLTTEFCAGKSYFAPPIVPFSQSIGAVHVFAAEFREGKSPAQNGGVICMMVLEGLGAGKYHFVVKDNNMDEVYTLDEIVKKVNASKKRQ